MCVSTSIAECLGLFWGALSHASTGLFIMGRNVAVLFKSQAGVKI